MLHTTDSINRPLTILSMSLNMNSSSTIAQTVGEATNFTLRAVDKDNVEVSFIVPASVLRQLPVFASSADVSAEAEDAPADNTTLSTGKVLKVKSKKDKLAALSDAEVAALAAKSAKRQETLRKSRESRLAPATASADEICQRIPRTGPMQGVRCGGLKTVEQAVCDYCWGRLANLKNSACGGMSANSAAELTEDMCHRLFDEQAPKSAKAAKRLSAGADSEEVHERVEDGSQMIVADDA